MGRNAFQLSVLVDSILSSLMSIANIVQNRNPGKFRSKFVKTQVFNPGLGIKVSKGFYNCRLLRSSHV